MVLQFTANWTTPAGGGYVSVLNFFGAWSLRAAAKENCIAFLDSVAGALNVDSTVALGPEVKELDVGSGTLLNAESLAAWGPESGVVTGEPMPDAVQGLLRWNTAGFHNGRRVRGRTFIPGLSVLDTTDGNLNSATVTALQNACNALLNDPDSAPFGVWCRPKNGAGGAMFNVTSGSPWGEFAVLRRRRN